MYLHYFERLVRYFSCDDTFRMPYWDWTAGGHVQVPDAFNDSTDDVLYVKGRLPAFDISVQDLKRQFANPFTLSSPPYGFGGGAVDDDSQPGVLFSSGHSEVHCNAGGCLPSPETAARDPLFFLLHSNIDRLWESWLMGKYGHNPRDSDWLNHEFTFANEIGAPERKKVSEFLDIAKLGYSYDRLETPEHVAPKGASIRWITVSALHNRLTPGSETLAADLSVTQEKLLRQALQTPASANLRLEVIDVSWRADPNVRYEACFDPQCKASVGNVSFCIFAAARHHQAVRRVPVEPMYLPIEAVQILAQQLNAQLASNRNAGRIHLWLVPRSIGLANGPVKLTPGSDPAIGSMRLSLAEVQSK